MSLFVASHRFTSGDYTKMISLGILTKANHVELLDGLIVECPPMGLAHHATVSLINAHFLPLSPAKSIVQARGPVDLEPVSQPEPDLALLNPRKDFYRHKLPGPKDILLIIEVADSSLLLDREVKVPLYAKAGITEMWLVDLVSHEVVVHRQPRAGKYTRITRHRAGDKIAPLAFPKHFLHVKELFG